MVSVDNCALRGRRASKAGDATVLGSVKGWVLAMLTAKRRLRVAPVRPAAPLTDPARRRQRKLSGRGTSRPFNPVASGQGRTRDITRKKMGI